MRFASVCSGIEAASVAWKPLGFEAAWYSEVEPFCCAVLDHHYPDTPNLGDITQITESQLEQSGPIDILVGGTPCQSFSVAGLRKGMADPRGNLALRFLQLAGATRAPWVLWENVPGVLSSLSHTAPDPCPPPPPMDLECDGQEVETEDEYSSEELHALNCFLAGLSQLGYGWAYRILNAEYFGVPQRRRRVFVVGYLRDWRRAVSVLFEREGMCRYPLSGKEAGKEGTGNPAACLNSGGNDGGFRTEPGEHVVACPVTSNPYGDHESRESLLVAGPLQAHAAEHGHAMTTQQAAESGQIIPFDTTQVTSPDNYSNPKPGDACHPLAEGQHPPAVAYRTTGNDGVYEQGDKTAAINCNTDPTQQIVAYQCQGSNVGEMGHLRAGNQGTTGGVPFVESSMAVRRLTPRECERLQGFPDDYTLIPYGNRGQYQSRAKSGLLIRCPDGPRYRALGNSMAVPVMGWIAERIKEAVYGDDD